MKRLILFFLFSVTTYTVFSQVTNQIQAKRGVFTEQLYLNGRWLNSITTDMNTDDTTSDNVIATAKAVADFMRSKIKPVTLQSVFDAGGALNKTNIVNGGNNLFVWNNNLANGYLYRYRIDNSNAQITRTIYTPDFSTATEFVQSPSSNTLVIGGDKIAHQYHQDKDGKQYFWTVAQFTGTETSIFIDTTSILMASGSPNPGRKQHKISLYQDSITIGAFSNKSDGTSLVSTTRLFLRGLPTSTSNTDSVLVKLPDGRIAYRGADAAASGAWTTSGSDIANSNTGNVAIGIATPAAKLHVQSREFGTEGVTAYINPIWNTTGNPTAFKVNPLVIANGGTSLLADFQYSGLSRLSIRHDGQLNLSGYSSGTMTGTPAYDLQTTNTGTVIQKVAPKVYTALLSQTATNDPIATILGTNTIGNIVWTRSAAGTYTGTLNGAFPAGKTFVIIGNANELTDNPNSIRTFRSTDNTIQIIMQNGQQELTDEINYVSFEVRVYP